MHSLCSPLPIPLTLPVLQHSVRAVRLFCFTHKLLPRRSYLTTPKTPLRCSHSLISINRGVVAAFCFARLLFRSGFGAVMIFASHLLAVGSFLSASLRYSVQFPYVELHYLSLHSASIHSPTSATLSRVGHSLRFYPKHIFIHKSAILFS
jgi:hypothetical protein